VRYQRPEASKKDEDSRNISLDGEHTFSILPSNMRTFRSISTCSTVSSVSVNLAFLSELLILSAVGYFGALDIGYKTFSAPLRRFGKLYRVLNFVIGMLKVYELGTHDITNQLVTRLCQIVDELRIQFIIGVPWSTSQRDRRFKAFQHVDLTRNMLYRLYALDQALLSQRLQTSIDNGLMKAGLRLEMFGPNSWKGEIRRSTLKQGRKRPAFISGTFDMAQNEVLLSSEAFCSATKAVRGELNKRCYAPTQQAPLC